MWSPLGACTVCCCSGSFLSSYCLQGPYIHWT